MSSPELVLGTRGSPLARWQTEQVLHALHLSRPGLKAEVKVIKTQGDQVLDLPLAQIGDKGLFTKELETALLSGEIDLAVHSLKDLPTTLPEGLALGAMLERHAPQDVLVTRNGRSLDDLARGACVGTGSLRRQTQLQRLRPDLCFKDLRGNIQTRLHKLERGDFDAIIMARAALERLGLDERIATIFPASLMLPAVGQGAIAVEIRADDQRTRELLTDVHHLPTALCCTAERAFLKRLGGGCEKPIAAHALLHDELIELYGFVASIDGVQQLHAHLTGPVEAPEALGVALAEQMLEQGARTILGL
ncbi:MAG: hydroxymethylbilane synthase [Candidatus Sericytochromatia bacterium]